VRAATAINCAPLDGLCNWDPLIVVGRAPEPGSMPPITTFLTVTDDYFATMGIQRVAGRLFDTGDFEHGKVAVVDERLVQLYFPGEDPLGRRVQRVFENDEFTIIGVVRHVAARSLTDSSPPAEMYMPLQRTPAVAGPGGVMPVGRMMTYIVRTERPPEDLLHGVRAELAALNPNIAMARVGTLEQTLAQARAPMAFTLVLLGIAGGVALVLGLIGIYGVITYAVAQRTGEIGVRMALGARPRDVAAMVLRQGGLVTLIGIIIGVGGAFVSTRLLRALLFGISPTDPLSYAAVTTGLLAVALFACWVPARRAARLDPLTALRSD
jgi:predicted permease